MEVTWHQEQWRTRKSDNPQQKATKSSKKQRRGTKKQKRTLELVKPKRAIKGTKWNPEFSGIRLLIG